MIMNVYVNTTLLLSIKIEIQYNRRRIIISIDILVIRKNFESFVKL